MNQPQKKLAIAGGKPVRRGSFAKSWPVIDEREKQYLMDVLEAEHLSSYVLSSKASPDIGSKGDKLTAFQEKFNEYLGVKHGITVINGTAALDIACRSLLMDPGDEVITPAHSFIASSTCILFCNTIPVFVDLDPETLCISPERIEEAITPRTKAIIAVHLDGYMCDMDRIMDIAEKHDLYVIEDCARAHASEWRGKKAGSIGHFGCFSFQSSKVMTCGEGGYLCTNDDHLFSRAWSLRNAGRQMAGGFYEHFLLGGNERMSQLEAAVLLAQLERFPEQARRREDNITYLEGLLEDIPGVRHVRRDPRVTGQTYFFAVFHYEASKFDGLPIGRFCEALSAEGFPIRRGQSSGLYKNPMLSNKGLKDNKLDFIFRDHGRIIEYEKLSFPVTESGQSFRLNHRCLLGDKEDMEQFAMAIRKVQENVGEVFKVIQERNKE